MLQFIIGVIVGVITGILIGILILVIMTYFRRTIERKVIIAEKAIENAGPRPRGFIVNPLDEIEESRERVIAQNREQGRSTPIEDLRL